VNTVYVNDTLKLYESMKTPEWCFSNDETNRECRVGALQLTYALVISP
jgi:hypothetical protein